MSIKTNNAMAALLNTTAVPSDVEQRISPSQAPVDEMPEPKKPAKQIRREVKPAKPKTPAAKSNRDDVNVNMDHLHKGESTKQFTLRMPVTMWARLKLMTTRAQLTGEGTKTQQEMILQAVEAFLEQQDDAKLAA
ncbi:MAG: hypothetical protein AAGD32_15670 [Planctomycetota bacterium]